MPSKSRARFLLSGRIVESQQNVSIKDPPQPRVTQMRHLSLSRRVAGFGIDLTPFWVITFNEVFAVSIPTIHRRASFSGDILEVTSPVRIAATVIFPFDVCSSVAKAATLLMIGSM
jgi:hypothetical protein